MTGRISDVKHRDGVPWFEAPVPPRDHECWAQTRAFVNLIDVVDRCACGAIRYGGIRGWGEVNARQPPEPEPVLVRRRFDRLRSAVGR